MNSLFCALLLLLLLLDSWRLLATLRAITYVAFLLGTKSVPRFHRELHIPCTKGVIDNRRPSNPQDPRNTNYSTVYSKVVPYERRTHICNTSLLKQENRS